MKIAFNGHSPTERETELTQEELALVFEVMKQKFLDHIEYGKFGNCFPSHEETSITKLCDNHQVDVDYEKDRVAFFTAIVDKMENPYV
jgi:hypothetical protein